MAEREWTDLRQWRTLRIHLVETRLFTRRVSELLSDEEYRQLQLALAERKGKARRRASFLPAS
jgi:hypothetical protein